MGVLGFVGHGLQKRTRKEIEERVGFEHSRRDEEIGRGKKESEDEPCTFDHHLSIEAEHGGGEPGKERRRKRKGAESENEERTEEVERDCDEGTKRERANLLGDDLDVVHLPSHHLHL